MWEMVHRLSMKLSFAVIIRFFDIALKGMGEEALHSFLRAADSYRHWLNILDFDIPILNRLAEQLHHRAHAMHIPIAIKPYAYGGEVLILSPLGSFRDALLEELATFRATTGIPCALDYFSWRDGFEREGLRVDQHLEGGISARFLSGETITLSRWDVHGEYEKITVSLEQIATERTAVDIFFDVHEKKIFVKGKALTSHELHSRTKAIEILAVLLTAGSAWVPSEQLPQSSYIDRNEMQSKIVSPLRAIVKRRCKKELPLELKGSVGAHFTMRFNPRGFTIAMRVAS